MIKNILFKLAVTYSNKRRKLVISFREYLAGQLKERGSAFVSKQLSRPVNEEGIIVGSFLGHQFLMNARLQDEIEGRLLIDGVWDRTLMELIARFIDMRQGDMIDIGANVGAVTIPLAVCHPQRSFHCFEPHPRIIERLKSNVILNNRDNIKTVPCAITEKAGEITFFSQTGGKNMGLSSVIEKAVSTGHEKISVKSISLDQYVQDEGISKISIVKIDVQGAEVQVLRGMRQVLRQFKPVVLFEHEDYLHSEDAPEIRREISEIFRSSGYKLYAMHTFLIDEYGYLPELSLDKAYEGNVLAMHNGME